MWSRTNQVSSRCPDVPLTFPAHQAVVLPIKLKWPARTDATAMCIGAATPDLGYPIFGLDGHSPVGLLIFAIPFAYLMCRLMRWRVALGLFGNVPDAGPFRFHSYRVLVRRRPSTAMTLVGVSIGAVSHVVVDAFTHGSRWGAQLLGLDQVLFTLPLRGDMTGARVLQYFGHTVGSLIAMALFLGIGRRRLLERWYDEDQVREARAFTMSTRARVVFWSVSVGVTVAVTSVVTATGGTITFSILLGLAVGVLVAGSIPVTSGVQDSTPIAQAQDGDDPARS